MKKKIIYPPEWPIITYFIKFWAGWKCEHCDHPDDPENGYTLTVHHLDHDPENIYWTNLVALCQRCHLTVDRWWSPNQIWFPVIKPRWAEIRGY